MNPNDDGGAGIRKIKNLWCDSWENCPKFKMNSFLENTNANGFHCDSKSFFPSNGTDYSKYDDIAFVIKEKNSKIGQELESIRETLRRCSQLNETVLYNENLEPDPFPEVVSQPMSKHQFPCCRCNCQKVGMNISAGDWRKPEDNLDRKEDLHEIARNLSTTLLELNSCKICKSFPEELKETVGTLKSLLDYINDKTPNAKLPASMIENVKSSASNCSQDEETIFEDAEEGFPSKIFSKSSDSDRFDSMTSASSHLKSFANPTPNFEKPQIKSANSVKSCQCNFPTNVGTQKDMEEKLSKQTETEKNLEPSQHKITVYKKSPSASNVFDGKSKEIVEEFLLEAISVFDKINNLDSMEEISAFSENEYGNQILNNLTKSELEQSFCSTSCISLFSSKISTREIHKIKTEEDWKAINFQKSEDEITGKPVIIENVLPELKFSIKKSEHFLKSKYKRKLRYSSIKSKSLTILAASPKINVSKYGIKSEPKTKNQTLVELKTKESKSKFDQIKNIHNNPSSEIKRNRERKPKTKNAKLKNESDAKPDKTLPEMPIENSTKLSQIHHNLSQPKKARPKLKEGGSLKLKPKSNEKILKLNSENSRSLVQTSNKSESLRSRSKRSEKTANISKELDSDMENPAKVKGHLTPGSETIGNEKVDVSLKFSAKLEEDSSETMKNSKTENSKEVETDFRADVIRTLNKSNKNVINVLAKVNKNVKEALESANQNLKIVLDVALKQKITKANLNKKMEESEKVKHPKEKRKKIGSSNGRKHLDLGNKECKVQTLSTIIKVQKYNNEDFYRFYRRQRRLVLFNPLETISDVDESLLTDQAEEMMFPIEELKTPVEIKQSTDATERIRESKRKVLTKRKRRSVINKDLEMEIDGPNCNQRRDSSQVIISNKPKSELEPPMVSQFPIISSKPKYIPKTLKCQLFDEIVPGKPLGETRNASLDTLADVVSITQYEVSVDTPEEQHKNDSKFKMEPEFEPELYEFENLNFDQIFGDSNVHPANCDCFDCLCSQYKKLNVRQNSDHSQNCCCLRCVEEILKIKNQNLDRKNKAYFEQQFNNCKETVEKLKKEVKQLGLASRMTIQNISRKSDVEQTFLAKSRSSIQLTLTGLKVALNCLQSNCNKNEHVISHIFKTKQLKQNTNLLNNNLLTEGDQEKVPDRNVDNAGDQVRPASRSETKVKQVSRSIIKEVESCVKFTSGIATKLISSEPNLGKICCCNVRKPNSPLRGKRSNRDLEIPNKFESEQYQFCKCEENLHFTIESNQTIAKQMKKKIILPRYNACWRPTSIKVQPSSTFKKKNLKVKRFAKFNRSPKFESKISLKTSKSKKEFVADKIVPVKSTTSECPKGLFQNDLDSILDDLFQAIEEIENIKHINQQKSHTENICTRNKISLISLLNEEQPTCAQNRKTKPSDLQFGSVFTRKITPKLNKKRVGEEKNRGKPQIVQQEIQKKLMTKKLQNVDKNLAHHPYAESISTLFNLCTNWENKFKKNLKPVKIQPKKTFNAAKANNFASNDLFPSKYNSNESPRLSKIRKLCPTAVKK